MPNTPLFIKACLAEPVDRIPVWLMRQAGRYLPEYRKLREQYPFLTLCKTPSLATEVTLQPLERFGMDAAILFSDILLVLEAMGVDLAFDEKIGPRLGRTGSAEEQVDSLSIPDPEQELRYVLDAIRQDPGPPAPTPSASDACSAAWFGCRRARRAPGSPVLAPRAWRGASRRCDAGSAVSGSGDPRACRSP